MNVKVLTKQELQYFKKKYKFVLQGNSILVYVNGYNRVTEHNSKCRINLTTSVRRITISVEALEYWSEFFIDEYSPIEVQNAMNFLKISYQNINFDSIRETMRKLSE